MKRSAAALAALWIAGPPAAATPSDPFNQNPLVSKEPPSVQLNFDAMPIGVTPRTLDIVALNGHAADLWSIAGDERNPRVPHMLAYRSVKTVSSDEAMELTFDEKAPQADHRAWSVGFPQQDALDHGDVTVSLKIGSNPETRAGIVYRYQDPSSYYFVEADPVAEFCTVYRIQKGKWKTVNRVSAVISADTWHTLRLIFQRDVYEVFIDNEWVIGGHDKEPSTSGRVGMAVSADGGAAVRRFTIRPPAAVSVPSIPSR